MSSHEPASKTYSFSGALAAPAAIKTSIATSAAPASYTGAGLNGTVGAASMSAARTIYATLGASVGSYVNGGTITVTGLDATGATISDVLTIVGTGGGTTVLGTKFFKSVTTIAITAQTDVNGTFQFGVMDISCPGGIRAIRCGTTGNLHVAYLDGSTDTIPKVAAGERIDAFVQKIFGDSTVQDLTVLV